MQSASPPPTISPLWERLRALFGRVIAAIGAPAILAALTFAPHARTTIVRQLTLLEILARKLLLAEAAALTPPSARGPRLVSITLAASGLYMLPRTRSHTPPCARTVDPANPETWVARFALAVPRDRCVLEDRRAPRIRALWGSAPPSLPALEVRPRRFNSEAFCVARRAEALRRLFADPAQHVQRLARARRIGVARSHDAIKSYAFRTPRRFVGDCTDPLLTVHIYAAALSAYAVLINTS